MAEEEPKTVGVPAMERKRKCGAIGGLPFPKIKARKVVVGRTYPRGCGYGVESAAVVEARLGVFAQHGSGKDIGAYAVRRFPKGCGRNVPRCNPALTRKLSVENAEVGAMSGALQIGVSATNTVGRGCEEFELMEDGVSSEILSLLEATEDDAFVDPDSPEHIGTSFVSKAVEVATSSVQAGPPQSLEGETLKSETPKTMEVDLLEGSEPMVLGASNILGHGERNADDLVDPNLQKQSANSFVPETLQVTESSVPDEAPHEPLALKSQTTESVDHAEAPDSGNSFMAEDVEEFRRPVPDDSPFSLRDLKYGTTNVLDQAEAPEMLRCSKKREFDQPQTLFPRKAIEGSVYLKLPRRRKSSVRDFPAGCSRKATSCSMDECDKRAVSSINRGLADEKSNGGNGVEPIVRTNGKEKGVVADGDACKGKLKKHTMQEAVLNQPVHARDSFDSKSKQKNGIKDSGRGSGMKSLSLSNEINISKNQHDVVKNPLSEHPKGKVIVQTPTATSNCPGTQGNFKPLSCLIKARKERIAERGDKVDAEEVARDKVKKARNLFGLICEELLRDKEAKRNIIRRIDCEAAKILKERNKWVNSGKPILGIVPGVRVGDTFRYRAELSIVGLHRHYQSGIDYLKRWTDGKELATSIVASGGYDDYKYGPDVLIYSGQGGNPGRGKEATDQTLTKGNLAMKNSKDEQTPVRVIRGLHETQGRDSVGSRINTGAALIYDGLYLVEDYTPTTGRHGKIVYMFQLRRMPGQPPIAKG